MTAPVEMLLQNEMAQSDRIRGAFLAALAIHGALAGGLIYSAWLAGHRTLLGAADAGGGTVAIQAVNSIPLPHSGPQNPLASDTESEVPQAPVKPAERVKEQPPPPDAIPLKSRTPKKTPADVAAEKNKFRPYKDLKLDQVYSKSAPAVSNPVFSVRGAGNVGAGANNTIGDRCPGYSAQIQQLVSSHWDTGSVDASIHAAPTVIATFDLQRDGSIRNIRILGGSGIASLDNSVRRAVTDSNPLPAIHPECGIDHAAAEFWFELKR